MSFFSVQNLSAAYGRRTILQNLSFELDSGCIAGILGANGSGKTTLLKAICGVIPHSGRCFLEDVPLERLSPRRLARLCSYIPQRSGLSIDLTALDVVLMGFNPRLGLLEHPNTQMRSRALDALKEVGLDDRAETGYLQLSEGQKQLCILARTLVSEARLMLLDEPESALDFRFRHRMLALLRKQADAGVTALVALHDPVLALNCCDMLLVLHNASILDVLRPQTDSLQCMEQALRSIYGNISLHRCTNRGGQSQIVILEEDL